LTDTDIYLYQSTVAVVNCCLFSWVHG